jgi:beta-lactamase class D
MKGSDDAPKREQLGRRSLQLLGVLPVDDQKAAR